MSVTAVVLFILCMAGLLGCFQRRLIYFPRSYQPSYAFGLPEGTAQLEYETKAGRQMAFYVPPREGTESLPDRLWLLFGGNAALSLDWLDVVEACPDPRAGFLLFDYPGYGNCKGKPTRQSILESMEGAVERLATHLEVEPKALEGRLCVLAHSLGASAGLELAVRRRCARLILISPFTSLIDMARRGVGWPLCHLLLDRFDNRALLAELSRSDPRPTVTIIHGSADEIVPVRMGRELAKTYPDWIVYQEIEQADHNFIITVAERHILSAMAESP